MSSKERSHLKRSPAPAPHGSAAPSHQVLANHADTAEIVQRALADPQRVAAGEYLHLQHTLGNRAVSQLVLGAAPGGTQSNPTGLPVQPKLTVGAADDPYEREADRIAARVLSARVERPAAAAPGILRRLDTARWMQREPLTKSITLLAKSVAPQGFSNKIRRTAADLSGSFEAGAAVESRLAASKGGGSPLPKAMRTFMEPRFGTDFGAVRVHTSAEAAMLNRQLGAKAFTHQNNIYLRDSAGAQDKALLAHELTHTIQQAGAAAQRQTIQRTLAIGGQDIADFNQFMGLPGVAGRLTAARIQHAVAQRVVEAMAGIPSQHYGLTLDALLALIPPVWQFYKDGTQPTGPEADRIKQIGGVMHQRAIGQKMSLEGRGSIHNRLAGVSMENSAALNQHLETHPELPGYIKQMGLKIRFNSGKGGQTGGGQYEVPTKTAHLAGSIGGLGTDHFMRVLLHEIGHGVFQRTLLKGELDDVSSKGKVDSSAMSDIEKAKFSEDGMKFYKAWEQLRKNGGRYMFGVDLDPTHDAPSRLLYQAADFGEFCAETFMHMAYQEPELSRHIGRLRLDPNTPREVLVAWRDVLQVLIKYKHIILKQNWARTGPAQGPKPKRKPVIGGNRLPKTPPVIGKRGMGTQQTTTNH